MESSLRSILRILVLVINSFVYTEQLVAAVWSDLAATLFLLASSSLRSFPAERVSVNVKMNQDPLKLKLKTEAGLPGLPRL